MSPAAKWEYMKTIYSRYHRADRKGKKLILDEFCKTYRCHRKHAIRLLNDPEPPESRPKRRRRMPTYGQRLLSILESTWEASGYLWSQRLKAALPLWMPHIRKRFNTTPQEERQLLSISPAQIDRRLKDKKRRLRRRIYGTTRPGILLKRHIPIKTDSWDVDRPGFTEVDLVSHSGDCAQGDFAHTLNVADIFTTWVERRCVLGKGQDRVCQALDEIRQDLPFPLLGIVSDNGSEFINGHLYCYCQNAPQVQFTRGRPYKKDDNAHIEQKNWTHVRKLLGYQRFDTQDAIHAINDLYRNELRWFQNFFQPSLRLVRKVRIGSRLKREYDLPKNPLERVSESGRADMAKLKALVALREQLDPFVLSRVIDYKLKKIASLSSRNPQRYWHRRGKHVYYRERIIEGRSHVEEPWPAVQRYEAMIERSKLLHTW